MDIAVAGTALCLLCVLITALAVAVKSQDRGPVFTRRRRIGKDGVPFSCLGFRTMALDADAILTRHLARNPAAAIEWTVRRSLRNDPRLTPLGRLLHATGLDELPQLVNVLRGEMSLVGPKPIAPEDASRPDAASADYEAVRPGLTGLWQCAGPASAGADRRAVLDREYVRTWSIWRDFAIIMRAIPAIVSSRSAC